jgi:hypothetical protein
VRRDCRLSLTVSLWLCAVFEASPRSVYVARCCREFGPRQCASCGCGYSRGIHDTTRTRSARPSANLLSRPTPSAFGVGQKNALRVTKLTSTNLTQGNPGWIRARRLTSLNAIGLWLIHLPREVTHGLRPQWPSPNTHDLGPPRLASRLAGWPHFTQLASG